MSTDDPVEPQTVRQNLVDEAAKFLINPSVVSHAEDQKSAFLRKKGLSHMEIQEAFAKAKLNLPVVQPPSGPLIQQVGVAVGPPVPAYHLPPPPSIWIKIRDICNFVLIITGASYGAYNLYKNYIGPLLTGRKQKSVDESMIELQQSVVSVLKEVQTTLSSLEKTLSVQNVRIQTLGAKDERGQPSVQQLEELKAEITSIKGLLINRRTFPSTPSMSPSIPSWQRTKAAAEEKAVEDPPVPVSSVQDEIMKPEESTDKVEKTEGELISDGVSGESGVDINDAHEEEEEEEDSNPFSGGENGLSAGESLSLAESLGDSSDEICLSDQ